ncbi:MBL fold metallo-hydrolase [Nostoc sp. KVJ3]|uniref:MBL fold metallo-hydrolase n=1 Tax=Nostoc sp. KVJ3 TaxID=457945 RepID=UPI0022388832|nr:MBL fold metallo-hydrolase [Nostoc sp. KVJ3]MCW5315528.1 MBL fold metallo-hydrolase [Nostoc sp. KVJ3]
MQIHLLGHASLFVETQDCKILMDPILWDSHCEGIEDICPKRQILHDQIPEFDILVISHQHTDHFDIRSLANLPKYVDVLIPKDKLIETCLRKLGYRHIYSLKDFNEVRIGSTRLVTTRSENRVPEYGMIFADSDGVFWNQVDSAVNSETIAKVKSRYAQIDFLLSGWQPMLETQYQQNQNTCFPYTEYSHLLKLIALIAPKAIAPGANGFKFINGSSWLNQIVFPVTREQFCRDVQQAYPTIGDRIFTFDPGDVITLKNGEVSYSSQKSSFVKKLADDYDSLYFSPVNIDSKLIDDNPEEYDIEEMKSLIEEEICVHLPQFFNDKKDSLLMDYAYWKVVYQLEVVFPDCSQAWYFDFSKDPIESRQGKNPLANVFSSIAASSFYGLLKGIKGWDWTNMGGYYRCFHKVYQATPYGIIKPLDSSNETVPDPLHLKFPYKEIYEQIRFYEIEKWGQVNDDQIMHKNSENPMVIIGNTLIKPQHQEIILR